MVRHVLRTTKNGWRNSAARRPWLHHRRDSSPCTFHRLCYIVAHGVAMTANSVVRARIDEQTKNEAAAVLKAIGLTVSDAFRLMMVKIAREKALPFELLVPNEETIEAMKAARRGELTTVGPPGKLIASLNADC